MSVEEPCFDPIPFVGSKIWETIVNIRAPIPEKLGHPILIFGTFIYLIYTSPTAINMEFGYVNLRISCVVVSLLVLAVAVIGILRGLILGEFGKDAPKATSKA